MPICAICLSTPAHHWLAAVGLSLIHICYQSALSKLNAARQARESAEAVNASELRKFHNGESTTFLVLQRQLELSQARGSELRAQTQLNESVVELQRVEGTILSSNGVNVQTLRCV